ncbi:MAG TPA: PDZ domain-containing protein [Pyrinomonadaceae bacterium]|nr:PDZ domain-containing protein [Pyrinomonadaceae bacterium]
MLRKTFLTVSVLSLAAAAAIAQDSAPKADAERAVRAFSFAMGDGGYLGVQTVDVSTENFAGFGLSSVRGVAVEKVVEGSPAEKAGLQTGDVILRFNGEEVTSARKLTRLVSEVAPDHTIALTVFRSGSEREIQVAVGKRPAPQFRDGTFSMTVPGAPGPLELKLPRIPEAPLTVPGGDGDVFVWRSSSSRQIGVGVTPLTKQLADHFGVEAGVMINNVREDSPAARAGLKAGDIIVAIDGSDVKGDMDLIRGITSKAEGEVELTIVRGGSRQTIRVTPEASPQNMRVLPAQPASPAVPSMLNLFTFPGRVI